MQTFEEAGLNSHPNKKRVNVWLRNPLISMVGQDRIELSTHGFSVQKNYKYQVDASNNE
jgi:hypothetical protein